MEALLKKYGNFVQVVQDVHITRNMAHGHDFDHAFAVANLAYVFCGSLGGNRTDQELAWMAGLCHNADRILALDRGALRSEVPDDIIEDIIEEWLAWLSLASLETLPDNFQARVVKAVLDHSKPNDKNDNMITIALKDADRVVNARLDVVIRSAQFNPEQPVIHPVLLLNDKRGKYNSRLTVVADLVDCLDWGNLKDEYFGVRSPAAKEMIVRRVEKLRKFLEDNVEQRREEGLVPYPAELISD